MSNQQRPQDGRAPIPPSPAQRELRLPSVEAARESAPARPATQETVEPTAPQRSSEPAAPEQAAEPPGPLPQRRPEANEPAESMAELTETAMRRLSSREFERELGDLDSMADTTQVDHDPEAVVRSRAAASMSPRHQFEAWIAAMVKSQASDLILRIAQPLGPGLTGGFQQENG